MWKKEQEFTFINAFDPASDLYATCSREKKRIPVDVLYSLNYAFFFNTWQKKVCTIIVKILCSFRSLQEQYYFFAFFI